MDSFLNRLEAVDALATTDKVQPPPKSLLDDVVAVMDAVGDCLVAEKGPA